MKEKMKKRKKIKDKKERNIKRKGMMEGKKKQ